MRPYVFNIAYGYVMCVCLCCSHVYRNAQIFMRVCIIWLVCRIVDIFINDYIETERNSIRMFCIVCVHCCSVCDSAHYANCLNFSDLSLQYVFWQKDARAHTYTDGHRHFCYYYLLYTYAQKHMKRTQSQLRSFAFWPQAGNIT